MFSAKLVRPQDRTVDGLPAIELVFLGLGVNGVAMQTGGGEPTYQRFVFVKRKEDLVILFIGASRRSFKEIPSSSNFYAR